LETCGICDWDRLCTGCDLTITQNFGQLEKHQAVIVDWETISLHFHYKEAIIERSSIQDPGKGNRF